MCISRSSRWRDPEFGQDTPGHRPGGATLAALCAALLLCASSCANPGPDAWSAERVALAERLEASLAASAQAPPAGSLHVRLAFGADVDLDLFVTDTDPRWSETVYFARHRTRGGGRLLRDARCSDGAPRVDAAAHEPPLAAGYRIGVDYHRSCGDRAEPAVFVVEWSSGDRRRTRRGIARPGHFDDRFWMLDAGDFGAAAPEPRQD